MGRTINLDGSEISVIKGIGLGGGEIDGRTLMDRCVDLEIAELIDTLHGLIMQGYVDADSNAFYSEREMERNHFRVNSGYSKDLKEALDPQDTVKKNKRVRRE